MDIIKIIGIGFLTLIITIILKEYKKEYAVYAVLIGGALIILYSIDTLKSIITFLTEISNNSNYNNLFISLLLKITGISICRDVGENSIANKIDFGGKILVISLSIPVISTTLETLTKLLPWGENYGWNYRLTNRSIRN